MFPHERSLVKRLEGKPFALLGINSDANIDKCKEQNKEQQINWRSWWNGGSTSGPISTAWNVSGWPTIYVLDAEGVIRAKGVHDKAMDNIVDQLLSQLQKKH